MNPIRLIAKTKTRLIVATLICLAVWIALAVPLTEWVRNTSTSTGLDLLVMTFFAFTMLAGATFAAILIADQIFPGEWRRRVVLGEAVESPDFEDDLRVLKAQKNYILPASAILVALALGSGWTFEGLTDGFFGEYSRFGFLRTSLRGDDTAHKLEVLNELGDRRREQYVEDALVVTDDVWRDPGQPEVVRAEALGALSRLGAYINTASDSWRDSGKLKSWQDRASLRLRQTVAPDLRRAIEEGSGAETSALRAPLMKALGTLRDHKSIPVFREVLEDLDGPLSAEQRSAVVALARIRDFSVLKPLAALVERSEVEADFTVMSWAIRDTIGHYFKSHADVPPDEIPKEVDSTLEKVVSVYSEFVSSGSTTRRCVSAMVLRSTRDVRIRAGLLKAFEAEGADEICQAVRVELGDTRIGWLGAEEPLKRRIIDGLGVVALGDADIALWASKQLDKGGHDTMIEQLLTDLLAQIQSRQ